MISRLPPAAAVLSPRPPSQGSLPSDRFNQLCDVKLDPGQVNPLGDNAVETKLTEVLVASTKK